MGVLCEFGMTRVGKRSLAEMRSNNVASAPRPEPVVKQTSRGRLTPLEGENAILPCALVRLDEIPVVSGSAEKDSPRGIRLERTSSTT